LPNNSYPKFSDFATEKGLLDGDKRRIDDVLNQEILLLNFKIKDSKKRQGTSYATIQFKQKDITYIIFSGSSVLIEQLNKYKEKLPFYTTIKKIDKYYTFA
jgi:hypothetical protein